MRLKPIKLLAIGALALAGVFASTASAEVTGIPPQTFHTVQTPTGPLQVPDVLHGTGTADGEFFEWFVSPCVRATPAQQNAYTRDERRADPDGWCFKKPGTIATDSKATAEKKSRKSKKKSSARKSKGIGALEAH